MSRINRLKGLRQYASFFYYDYVRFPLQQGRGRRVYPSQLNFSVTGFCNSQCVMCNVWQFPDQRPMELSPDELFTVLSDPLFRDVRHWGIAGGEPFLRKDLAEMAEAGLRALPDLQTLTISTHAYHTRRLKEVAPAINELCKARGVRMRISISLDGVGEVHDRVRGVPGAFDRTWRSIRWVRDESDIDLVIGATLSPYNVNDAFELWHFCVRENIPTNFRIATIVERLGNRDLLNVMSVKDRDEYALAEIFENLAHHHATPMERRFFYLSARRNLTERVPRFAVCRFKDEGIFLNEMGNLHHCAVYGQSVGSAREESGEKLIFSDNGEALRQQMLRAACPTCVHDYRTRIPLREIADFYMRKYKVKAAARLAYHTALAYAHQFSASSTRESTLSADDSPHYLVIGWYGTETAGDKAILGGIMETIRRSTPQARFTIASSLPFYTRNTVAELGAQSYCSVIPYDYSQIAEFLPSSNAVVVGGGPLMDLIEVLDLVRIFDMAHKQQVRTALVGVGVGPLKRRLTKWGVKRLLTLADSITVRDSRSKQSAVALGVPADKIKIGTDPSVVYLDIIRPHLATVDTEPVAFHIATQKISTHGSHSSRNNTDDSTSAGDETVRDSGQLPGSLDQSIERPQIGIAVRDWPRKYATQLDDASYKERREWLIQFWADLADQIIETFDAEVSLIPMNTLHIGGDDRWLHLDVRRKSRHSQRIHAHTRSYSAEQIGALISRCTLLIGMRFHSVVFGTVIGVPTLAIDYTQGGGKVGAYMKELGMSDYTISIDNLNLQNVLERLTMMWSQQDTITGELNRRVSEMLPLAVETVTAPLNLTPGIVHRPSLPMNPAR